MVSRSLVRVCERKSVARCTVLSSFVDAHQRPSERGIKPAFHFFICFSVFQAHSNQKGYGRAKIITGTHVNIIYLHGSVSGVDAEAYPRCADVCRFKSYVLFSPQQLYSLPVRCTWEPSIGTLCLLLTAISCTETRRRRLAGKLLRACSPSRGTMAETYRTESEATGKVGEWST